MAFTGKWTVIFEDKSIIKNCDDFPSGQKYEFTDSSFDTFWSDSKFSNVWAIQYTGDTNTDQVEYRDTTPHSAYDDSVLGNFTTQFKDKWDAKHLSAIQSAWDENNVDGETSDEKIARLGARPTSYSSN